MFSVLLRGLKGGELLTLSSVGSSSSLRFLSGLGLTARRSIYAQVAFKLPPPADEDTMSLAKRLIAGERRALAKCITLVESTLPSHKTQASSLITYLTSLQSQDKNRKKSLRVGISGPPGVGKSTFIEAFGMYLTSLGLRVAVLAIDPSSSRSGGSILGDKTRMYNLSQNDMAYVRPSPSGGTLGGVTRNTTESILICEAASYDVIIVETVGVGQSETAVDNMVDLYMVLLPPAGGDELQGIKKGIIEHADLIVFNKADGELKAVARRAQNEYQGALAYISPKCVAWKPKVVSCSALTNENIPKVWELAEEFRDAVTKSGDFDRKRKEQRRAWLWTLLNDAFLHRMRDDPKKREQLEQLENMVVHGLLPAGWAAECILDQIIKS